MPARRGWSARSTVCVRCACRGPSRTHGSPPCSSGWPSTCSPPATWRPLRVSWDEAWHLLDRAVARGLAAKPLAAPVHVGVDEKAAGRGQDYITVVSDLDAGTVQYIADERRQASLDGFFDRFSDVQLTGIQAVAMDMWEPYAASARAHLPDPDSKIVFDRYHLMGYLTKAVDTVRKAREPSAGRRRRQEPGRVEVPVAVLGGEPARASPGPLRHPAGR